MLADIRSIMVSGNKSIFEVMKAINDSGSKFALVVDSKERLVGIVTDGDIRRGFLSGHNAQEPVKNVMNNSPVVAKEGLSRQAMIELVNEKYAQIPVVSQDGRVKGIITFKDKNILLDVKSRQICVVGLGFVGLTFSMVLADLGFKVFGYDIDNTLMGKITRKQCPFHEKGLEAYINRYVGNNFIPISEISSCKADIYVIAVGTPVGPKSKIPNLTFIKEAAKSIGANLKPGDLLILRSTVPVGTTRNIVLPILNKLSGLKAGIDYYLAFAPERTITGKAISELRELPQVIGGYDQKSTILADRLFREVTSTIIDVGSLEGAEMVKILNNTFRDVKFAYANEIALICKELGLDMVKLVHAANQEYTRDKIPLPSPGVGGTCLTKDPYILMYSCRKLKHHPEIVKFSRQVNELIPYKLAQEIAEYISQKHKKTDPIKIFIIGFAFKGEPETSDVRGSTTIDLLNHLRKLCRRDSSFFGYDPVVYAEEINRLGVKSVSLKEGFKGADAVIIMNNHKSYYNMNIFDLLNTAKKDCLFVDGWSIFDPKDIESINKVRYLGVGCRRLT